MRLPRTHRLKRKRLIRPLFDRSRSDVEQASVGCVRVLYRLVDRDALPARVDVQAGFVVGRRIGPAVTRNRIRRQMREAWRLGRGPVVDVAGTRGFALTALFLFRGQAPQADACIPHDMPHLLNLLARRLGGEPGS